MSDLTSFIKHYQNSIEKNHDDPERVLHCLKKLIKLRITVQHLQDTGIGRTVNSVRKQLDGEAGELARNLVDKWKALVAENGQNPEPEHKHSRVKEHEQVNVLHEKPPEVQKSHHSKHERVDSKDQESKKTNESSKKSESKHHHHHHSSRSTKSSHSSKSSSKRKNEDESKEYETKAKKHKETESDKKSIKTSISSSSSGSNSNIPHKSTDNKERKSNHKNSSSSSSPSKKKRDSKEGSQEFDGTQGMGFAEALASFDMPSSSSKVKKEQLADKITVIKTSSSSTTHKSSSSSASHKSSHKDKPSTSSQHTTSKSSKEQQSEQKPTTSKNLKTLTQPPKLLTQKPILDTLPDLSKDLPIPNDVSIPEYRPLPLNSTIRDYINTSVYGANLTQSRHQKSMLDSDLLAESFSSKANRTKVYSGNMKNRSQIPKLFDMCIRILQENIDFLECTGGVPFEILRPVLERAKPDQLLNIEYYNPYLLEDTDVLWKPHCQRRWKNKQPLEMETWRDMYERCVKEDEEKLNRLTQNIKQHQEITSNGIQKTKMAFVDTLVKPPRGVKRKQDQFLTDCKLVASPAARTEGLRNLAPNIAKVGDVRLRVAAGLRDDAQQVVGRGGMQRTNISKAPMMRKILSKFKR